MPFTLVKGTYHLWFHLLGGFGPWLEAKREQVLDPTTGGFTHFDKVVEIRGNRLKMLRRPEDLVFYNAKTTSPSVSPSV